MDNYIALIRSDYNISTLKKIIIHAYDTKYGNLLLNELYKNNLTDNFLCDYDLIPVINDVYYLYRNESIIKILLDLDIQYILEDINVDTTRIYIYKFNQYYFPFIKWIEMTEQEIFYQTDDCIYHSDYKGNMYDDINARCIVTVDITKCNDKLFHDIINCDDKQTRIDLFNTRIKNINDVIILIRELYYENEY